MSTNILISIGNSDDKLSQKLWCNFVERVREELAYFLNVGDLFQHGEWFSSPDSPWQNANWCVQINPDLDDLERGTVRLELRTILLKLCKEFGQDSIAWTEGEVEFLSGRS